MSLIVVDKSPLVIDWFDWIVLLGWLRAKREIHLFPSSALFEEAILTLAAIGLKGRENSLWKQDGSGESPHPLRSDKLAYLPNESTWNFITIVAINCSFREALVPSLNTLIDWLILDMLAYQEASQSIIWLDSLWMCLLVRFDLSLFWLDHQGILIVIFD